MDLIIAGDIAPITDRMICQVDNGRYGEMFPSDLVSVINNADYSIVNLECPIVKSVTNPIKKNGPSLKCSSQIVDAIKYAGFKGVTLANNHVMDQGEVGLKETVSCCQEHGLDSTGVGNNLDEASEILYVEKNEEKLAVINCCEHEFSVASNKQAGANPLNPVEQYRKIKEARLNADYVVVIVHGGHEHYQLPSPRMKKTYQFFIDAGADAVVNHHQHCYSGYEIYKNKPIVYGTGNFAFDWEGNRNVEWNNGYLVELQMNVEVGVNLVLHPYIQYSDSACVQLLCLRNDFESEILRLNEIIGNDKKLYEKFEMYCESRSIIFKSIIEPSQNRWIRSAINHHLLPSMITRQWLIKLYNIINCESHRDVLLRFLNNETK